VALPTTGFAEFPASALWAAEPDVWLGRRGLAGWDGLPRDVGLGIPGTPYLIPASKNAGTRLRRN
jgi:hypothetical protein